MTHIEKSVNPYVRLVMAQMLEGKSCHYCQHKYTTVDDCIERDVVAVNDGGSLIACKACYDVHNVSKMRFN